MSLLNCWSILYEILVNENGVKTKRTRYRSLLTFSRLLSRTEHGKIEKGIRDKFNEYEVRLYFNEWLKALWLAPNQWVHSTRDSSIRVTRYFIPFWNITLQGSVQCSLSTKSNLPFRHDENYYSHREWHSFPLEIENIHFNNINIYGSDKLDKYHVQKLDVSFDDDQLSDLTDEDRILAKPTIDKDEALHNAWILIIKPLLEDMCLRQTQEKYPKFENPRIDSFHLTINSKQERLLYYPIYVINYTYDSKFIYTCLFDGVTGHITGDRQFSTIKVMLATLATFYPMLKIGIFSFGTLANLLFAFEIASDLSFIVCLPIAAIVAPCVGLYARSYAKNYKQELSQIQWKQDQSKALKFTYDSFKSIEESKENEDSNINSDKQSI
ncbi:hypothetical protein I4U23_023651 [Adineta vaga]|nr:hypothetical protein I4U23_023651 [Adineta vaga]